MYRKPLEAMLSLPPYIRVPRVFSVDDCSTIINGCLNGISPTTAVTGTQAGLNPIRESIIRWIEPTLESNFIFEKIDKVIEDCNSNYFNFDISGYTKIQFTEYTDGSLGEKAGKYDWHIDTTFTNDFTGQDCNIVLNQTLRKLSVSVVLNQQDIDFYGGSLEMVNYPTPILNQGDLLIFPSFLSHRVTQIIKGTRYSLVVWVLGPRFR